MGRLLIAMQYSYLYSDRSQRMLLFWCFGQVMPYIICLHYAWRNVHNQSIPERVLFRFETILTDCGEKLCSPRCPGVQIERSYKSGCRPRWLPSDSNGTSRHRPRLQCQRKSGESLNWRTVALEKRGRRTSSALRSLQRPQATAKRQRSILRWRPPHLLLRRHQRSSSTTCELVMVRISVYLWNDWAWVPFPAMLCTVREGKVSEAISDFLDERTYMWTASKCVHLLHWMYSYELGKSLGYVCCQPSSKPSVHYIGTIVVWGCPHQKQWCLWIFLGLHASAYGLRLSV